MLKRIVVGSLLAAAYVGHAAKDTGSGTAGLTVREEPSRVVIRWQGEVDTPMRDKLADAFAQLKPDPRPVVIALDSPGGRVQHGSEVISLILKQQSQRNVYTTVEDGAKCASMCVPIYLAGSRRSAAPAAKFMFHEVSFGRQVDDKLRQLQREHGGFQVAAAKRYLVNTGTDDLFERYLKTAGASPKWMAEMRREVRGRDVWRSGRQLVEQRSGVVHALTQ